MPARNTPTPTPGHVFAPSLWIGTMSLLLVVSMDTLGFWNSWNATATEWTSRLGDGMREVPSAILLMMTALIAYAAPLLMLSSPHWWRRLVLWVSLTALTAGWLPVLALASWKLPPSMPLIALFWSGLCSFIYALRHRLPCESAHSPALSGDQDPAAEI